MDLVQPILEFLHLLATVIWIGGMSFNVFVLRPSLSIVETSQRLRLVGSVLHRFIYLAWVCIGILFLTGLFIANPIGPFRYWLALAAKHGLVIVMVAIVTVISLVLYPRFSAFHRETGKNEEAARVLKRIATLVQVNLALGFAVLFLTAILGEI